MKSSNMGLFAIAAAIAFVGALWAGVPLAGLATVMIFLACPLMMFFMMRGMGGMGSMGSGHTDTSAMDTDDLPAPHGTRAQRLAKLKARNDALAREIAALEDEEPMAEAAPPVSAGTPRDRTGVPA